jgi:hypothetical protein
MFAAIEAIDHEFNEDRPPLYVFDSQLLTLSTCWVSIGLIYLCLLCTFNSIPKFKMADAQDPICRTLLPTILVELRLRLRRNQRCWNRQKAAGAETGPVQKEEEAAVSAASDVNASATGEQVIKHYGYYR